MSNNPVKELPVFYPVVGVYQDCFFSLVSPTTILEKLSIDASVFPKELQEISEDSNPVLMFYKVKKETGVLRMVIFIKLLIRIDCLVN